MSAEQTIIDTLAKLREQNEGTNTAKLEAFEALLNEISATLTDAVAALEKDDDSAAVAQAITAGLKDLRITVAAPTVNVAAPSVTVAAPNVNVAAPSVTVTPHITVQPPAEPQGETKHSVEFHYSHGVPIGMTITRKAI